jgi:hypothetical protein
MSGLYKNKISLAHCSNNTAPHTGAKIKVTHIEAKSIVTHMVTTVPQKAYNTNSMSGLKIKKKRAHGTHNGANNTVVHTDAKNTVPHIEAKTTVPQHAYNNKYHEWI